MPSRSASARTPGTTCQHIQAMSTMTQGWRCPVQDRHRRMRKAPQDIERNLPWLTNDPWTASPMAIRPNRLPNASIGRRLHSKVDDRASRRPQQHHEQKPGAHTGHTAVRMRRHRVSDLQPPDPNDKCSCGFLPVLTNTPEGSGRAAPTPGTTRDADRTQATEVFACRNLLCSRIVWHETCRHPTTPFNRAKRSTSWLAVPIASQDMGTEGLVKSDAPSNSDRPPPHDRCAMTVRRRTLENTAPQRWRLMMSRSTRPRAQPSDPYPSQASVS